MSDDWINKRLEKMFSKKEMLDFDSNGYESVLFKINKKGEVNPIKLSKGDTPKPQNELLNYLL